MRKKKYVVLLGDGMPDRPILERDGKTPLMLARTPNLDRMAAEGCCGSVNTTPVGYEPGSDVTNMGILGYDPCVYYTGRAPLEAAAMGIELGTNDIAFRCNLVTLEGVTDGVLMEDFSAGHIETKDSSEIIKALQSEFGNEKISFYPGVSYRNLMVWKNGKGGAKLKPPHDISGKNIREHMPSGEGAELLTQLMNDSQMFLKNLDINKNRKVRGKSPANSIWLWGQGGMPCMPTLKEMRNLTGAMITAVDLMKGIGINSGMQIVNVNGATGWIDTNYEGKAEACLKAIQEVDLVYLHVESPDEAGHMGNLDYKIKAIEDFDEKVVGPVLFGLEAIGEFRAIALSDHSTPVEIKTHTTDPVPFAIYPAIGEGVNTSNRFDERIVETSVLQFDSAVSMNNYFIEGKIS
ncbi:MAG TPA: cofactor-independent phosphoglycerate mutase [Nitrospinota bacterium]|nr:cofactor-independent phosphoglycerate mutase [Nitrospinota bacterium]|tara:strand:- start:30311 stop:31528 length:1218 start_codon:yes stop_codon:yes gene_type:complete